MNDILNILAQIRATTSTNEKLAILKENKDNALLQRVLKLTYDTVSYNFYVTPKTVPLYEGWSTNDIWFINDCLDILENELSTRSITGDEARNRVSRMLAHAENADLILKVLDRDLKLGIGKTIINKVWKDLCIKPPYQRCSIYNEKTAKKIKYPSLVQIKADGTFRYAIVSSGKVSFISRSGEEYEYPVLQQLYSTLPDGVYVGELLVEGISNRAEANGLLNSDNPPHDKIYHSTWDCIPLEEYSAGGGITKYRERFETLKQNLATINSTKIQVIESHEVNNLEEALSHTVRWMNMGLEGSILKDYDNVFKSHTSPTMLKLKVEAECEVICTGFTEGTKGTKREATFGAITFESSDGLVKGQTSGFTDAQLEDYNNHREELIGKVFTIKFNDVTKANNSDTYALSHPRFEGFREKEEADTYERIIEQLNSAKLFKGK